MAPSQQRAENAVEFVPRRRSGRLSAPGGQKSNYFEADSDDELGVDSDFNADTQPNKANIKRKRGRPSKADRDGEQPSSKKARLQAAKNEDDGDDGDGGYIDEQSDEQGGNNHDQDDDEDEIDEDAPPRITIIPHKKMREIGKTPYEDDKLHQNTLLFLKDLKANNKRDWLKSTDDEYRRSLKDWNTFVETLTEKIIAIDPTIPELPIKDVVFRIYRDIRFSKDPTPYKPYYSAAFSRTGRKGPYACYYIHCEPGSCFIGGGTWMPEAGKLAKLRASIDEHPQQWRRVLSEEGFRRTFLAGTKKGDAEGCIKAFTKHNKGNALKKKPKNYEADHRDIELLKLRNFTIGKKIPDSVFTAPNGQEQIVAIVQAMVGYVTFLNSILMPDITSDSDSSSEDDDDDDDANGENQDDEE
ncbi:hypothetical protein BD289DRAFT_23828 [Coniella lustricola]|uniref:Uncharacterized protein n=1 Tax=Coniella lustricola TaxID=2025994 RepID=A0A2T3A374_9PEZI|nr:hypothetical protein BD289DRAFT_23828 [Coniella lustricola]